MNYTEEELNEKALEVADIEITEEDRIELEIIRQENEQALIEYYESMNIELINRV